MKNYYSILEVDENASKEVIDKAYKVLVKKYHPDLQLDSKNEEKIRDINEAYRVLSDDFLREQYDKEYKEKKQKYSNLQENDYSKLYREKERLRFQLEHEKYEKEEMIKNSKKNNSSDEEITGSGPMQLLKIIFKNRPRLSKPQKPDSQALIAMGLAVLIVIVLGVLLYFIPFTHDWMYRNFIDTPIVNGIKSLFGG